MTDQATNPDAMPTSSRPTNVRWIVFALGCGTSWTLYLQRYTFAMIKPKLQEEWGIDKVELGLLDTAFSVCYMAFQVPAGIVADLMGAHLFLGGIIIAWSLSLALLALAPSSAWLWYARAAFGTSQAGAYASLSRVTLSWFPASIRTTLQGWVGVFSGRIGGASAYFVFSFVLLGLLHFSWRTGVYVFAGAGVLLGALFLLLYRDSPRRHPRVNSAEVDLIEETNPKGSNAESESEPDPPAKKSIRELVRGMSTRSIVNLLCINLQSILSTVADAVYSTWIPMFLLEVYFFSDKQVGIFAPLPLIGGAFGGVAGGFLNDWLIRRSGNRRWSRTAIGLIGKGSAGVVLLVALLFFDRPYIFCGMLLFVKFLGDWSLVTLWGTITDIGGKSTATVYGFNNAVAAGIGGFAPPLYGYVAQYYGWREVFACVGVLYLLCAASWLLIDCTIPLIAEEAESRAVSTTSQKNKNT